MTKKFISFFGIFLILLSVFFAGCSTDSESGSADDPIPTTPAQEPQKTSNDITITFNANDGTSAPATTTQTAKSGTTVTLKENTFTRTGYTFQGWAVYKNTDYISYKDKASYTPSSSITLYAVWKANKKSFTVTFNGNGGTTSDGSSTTTQTVNYPSSEISASITLNANPFTKEGCSFIGWGTSADATKPTRVDEETFTLYYSATFYAIWVNNEEIITITLDSNNGSGETKTVNAVKNQETALSTYLNAFEWEYGKINGWLKNKTDTEKITKLTFTEDTTIYASWKENPKITFDANGGMAADGTAKKFQYLKGSYIENVLFEQFVPEGGDKTTSEVTVKLDANTFTRDGYVFKGWTDLKDSTKATCIDKQVLTIKSTTVIGITVWSTPTLYAVWEKIPTITYKMNGGSDDENFSETGRTITTKTPTAKYDYYNFDGWGTLASDINPWYYAGDTYEGLSDTTLYAVWSLDYILNNQKISVARNNNVNIITFTLLKEEWLKLEINPTEDKLTYTITNGNTVVHTSKDVKDKTTKTVILSAGTYTLKAENTEKVGSANTATISLY